PLPRHPPSGLLPGSAAGARAPRALRRARRHRHRRPPAPPPPHPPRPERDRHQLAPVDRVHGPGLKCRPEGGVMKTIVIPFLACIACGSAAKVAEPPTAPVPDNLKPPAGQTAVVTAHAVGVQIYECKPKKDDPSQLEWALKGPEAELLDAGGTKIGKHYLGPTWEANDGSKVGGEGKAKDPGPDPTAGPWPPHGRDAPGGSR